MAFASAGHARAAEPVEVKLDYHVSPGAQCPSESEFRHTVAELLEYDPFTVEAPRTVSVEISGAGGVLSGRVQWRDRRGPLQGERRFDSPDAACDKLARNMAFAVTVQIQLLSVPQERAPAAPAPPPPPEPVPRRPESGGPQRPEPTSRRSPGFEIGVGTGPFVVFGWSPRPSAGGELFLVGRTRTLSAQLGFEATLPSRVERGNGEGFESYVLAGTLTPCFRSSILQACALVRIGSIHARGFGVDEPRSPTGFLSQAGLRLALSQTFASWFEGRAHAQVAYTLAPWTVELNGMEAFDPSPVSCSLGIDAVVLFQ